MDEESSWLHWSRDHPWLFAALIGAIPGVVMALIATDEKNSLAVGIVAGLLIAIPLFVVGGIWGSLQKRRAERKGGPTDSRLGAWRRAHPILYPVLLTAAGTLVVFFWEWLGGRPTLHALILAAGVPVIGTFIALLNNRAAKSGR